MTKLSERHIEYLQARAVDLDLAWAAGVRSVDGDLAAQLLGRNQPLMCGGLAIPYPETEPLYTRIRMDDGGARYMAPAGRPVPVYVPKDTAGAQGVLHVVESPI